MTSARDILENVLQGVCTAREPEGLCAIHGSDCEAVIWHRDPPAGFQPWIDGLWPEQLPVARAVLRPAATGEAIGDICELSGMPDCAERDWLIGDVDRLAKRFCHMVRAPFVRLRLDAVTTNSCRKFHVDAVTARLICTYRGAGTQYGMSAMRGTEPVEVFTAPTGAPMVLKGSLWPMPRKVGLLHRSPPIEGTGEARLVLVLDPIHDDLEDDF
ncbi:MAG: DUF1826 domain-containing protein [Pseudomonadota bacterium]